jgi:hypothetical protein
MNNLPSRVAYTVMFLRMAETEMRELAEHTPEIGRELQHIAEALNGEAGFFLGIRSHQPGLRSPILTL